MAALGTRARLGGAAGLAIVAALAVAATPCEYRRVASPDGRWYAVATSPRFWSLVPVLPGQAGDKPGRVAIYAVDGGSRGAVAVEMVQQIADLRWRDDEAEIPLVARWDLARATVTTLR